MAKRRAKRLTGRSHFQHRPLIMDMLPDELIYHICLMLAVENPRQLLPVSQICLRFHRIASPLLAYSWRHGRHTNVARFIQHLVHHPEVCKEIRHLKFRSVTTELTWKTNQQSTQGTPLSTLSEIEKDLVVGRVLNSLDVSNSLARQIRLEISDALLAVLLCWATNLESLDLAIPTLDGHSEIFSLMDLCSIEVHLGLQQFGRLESVSLGNGTKDDFADGSQIAPFFRLPRLRSLKLKLLSLEALVQAEDGKGSGHIFPRKSSSIERLIIRRSRVTKPDLGVLLSACRHLKQLELGRQLVTGDELLDILPGCLETIKINNEGGIYQVAEWLNFYDIVVGKVESAQSSLKILNLWDVQEQSMHNKKDWADLIESHSNERVQLITRDFGCDSVYDVHLSKNCRCYWSTEQRRRYENRKRRGQI